MDHPSLIHGAQGSAGDPLVLPSRPITRSRTKKFGGNHVLIWHTLRSSRKSNQQNWANFPLSGVIAGWIKAFEWLAGWLLKSDKDCRIWIGQKTCRKGELLMNWPTWWRGYWTSRLVVHAVNTAGLVEDSSDEQQASYSADLILNKAAGCAASLIVQGWLGQQNCLRVGISARQQVSVGRPKSLARLD